jgi:hypothetical protein
MICFVDILHTLLVPTTHLDPIFRISVYIPITGLPKGVQLTHGNLCSNIHGMLEIVRPEDMPDARSLSFLPWAHSIGALCERYGC